MKHPFRVDSNIIVTLDDETESRDLQRLPTDKKNL